MQKMLNEYRAALMPIAAVLLIVVVGWMLWQFSGPSRLPAIEPRVSQAYFYDLNTGQLFEAPAGRLGPIETDSGPFEGHPAGVLAHVFSCDDCGDPDQQFIGWLEMPDPSVDQEAPPQGNPADQDDEFGGTTRLIRHPERTRWHKENSPPAIAIMREVNNRCNSGKPIVACRPPSVPEP